MSEMLRRVLGVPSRTVSLKQKLACDPVFLMISCGFPLPCRGSPNVSLYHRRPCIILFSEELISKELRLWVRILPLLLSEQCHLQQVS